MKRAWTGPASSSSPLSALRRSPSPIPPPIGRAHPHLRSKRSSEAVIVKSTLMLISGSISSAKTHYNVLSINEDASYDEIRLSYKAAILNSHPDKLQSKPESLRPPDAFLDIQKAWEVLSDSKLRSNYDKQLQASRHEEVEVVADEIRLEEMGMEDVDDMREFSYQCRCGDYFSVSSMELEKMGMLVEEDRRRVIRLEEAGGIALASVLLPCGSCSTKIRLIIDVNC